MRKQVINGVQVFFDVTGEEQMNSCMSGTQTIFYGKAFESSDGVSISVAITPKLSEQLLNTGTIDKIGQELAKILGPIADECEVEIYIGSNSESECK